jgi:hypothetical protein
MKYTTTVSHIDIRTFNDKHTEGSLKLKDQDYQLLEMLYQFAFAGNAKAFTDESVTYYWFSPALVQQQFPDWNIGRTTCFAKLAKLVDLKLIARHPQGRSFQGYFAFTDLCKALPCLGKVKGSAENSAHHAEAVNGHVKTIEALQAELKKLTSILQGKDEQIKILYDTINAQERTIIELRNEPKTAKEKPPRHETDEMPLYQLCRTVYLEQNDEFNKQVHNSQSKIDCVITMAQEKKLKELVDTICSIVDAKMLEPTKDDKINAFRDILSLYIELAKNKQVFYWNSFTPDNLLRNFSDFYNKIQLKINNELTSNNSTAHQQDATKDSLKARYSELRDRL